MLNTMNKTATSVIVTHNGQFCWSLNKNITTKSAKLTTDSMILVIKLPIYFPVCSLMNSATAPSLFVFDNTKSAISLISGLAFATATPTPAALI